MLAFGLLSAGVLPAAADANVSSAAGEANIYTVAGTGVGGDSGDGDQATEAGTRLPRSMFPTLDGGYIFAEPYSDIVRRVDGEGIVTTVAGTGNAGFSGDGGPATAANINFPHSASPTSDGGFLIADTLNNRIRRVSPGGTITTVAGTGIAGYSGDDGPATAARINNPRGVVALSDGGFLIPDSNNHRVRRVSSSGIITTVAGTGVPGFGGDGGQARAALISLPFGVAPTADGGFLIVDTGNNRLRRVTAEGAIVTMAGTGTAGYNGDERPAVTASLYSPHNAVATSDGGAIIADTANARVRMITPDGTISTLAGTGTAGYDGDGGPASAASLNRPKAVAIDDVGASLIADESNNRIRFVGTPVRPQNSAPPTILGESADGLLLTAFAGGWSGTGPVMGYQWLRCDGVGQACAAIPRAVTKEYRATGADVGSTLRVTVTASNAAGSSSVDSVQTPVVKGAGTLTVRLTESGDDGEVLIKGGTGYPPQGSASATTTAETLTARRSRISQRFTVSAPLIRFDTAAIPDGAVVTSATLKLYVTNKVNSDGRNLVGEWYSAGNWPIDSADYSLDSTANAFDPLDITVIATNASTDLILKNLTPISTTGYTGLRLHIDGAKPSGGNIVEFAAVDHHSLPEPQLIVNYTVR